MNKKIIKMILPLVLSSFFVGCNENTSSLTSEASSVTSSVTFSQPSSVEETHVPTTYYASPEGKPTNDGSKENPYDLFKAFASLKKGDTLVLLDGTYLSETRFLIEEGRNGDEENKITVKAENPGKVILDFSRMPFDSNNRGIQINANWWVLYGLIVRGAGDNGIYIGGHHNWVEKCETYKCRDTGIQLGRASSLHQKIESWPSFNTIINCTSHDNADPTGEDSDGFACKLTTGIGNVFKGCIAYNNIDDGWDLYTKADSGPIGPVLLEDCVAFNNGVTSDGIGLESSDGNGFKLGGESIAVQHIVKNCVAFNNLAHGFTDNSNPGSIWIENCTSYNNSIREVDANNIDLARDISLSNGNYFKNILSYSSGEYANTSHYETQMTNSRDQYYGSASHCVFFNGLTTLKIEGIEKCDYSSEQYRGQPFKLSTTPFVSTEVPQVGKDESGNYDYYLLRDENFNIDLGDFLRLKDNSELRTMGENSSYLGASLTSKEAK